jgi:eukaryotic-like serine/threonine-protein kinase
VPQNRLAHQVVADRYELLDSVGRGGFGVVWRACDTLLQRHVAVKEINIPGFLNEGDRAELREKVLKEARAAARLDHPNAVTVFDVIDDDGSPVIVMELVEAPNLSQLVQQQGPLAPAEAARIGLEVLDVLDAAHDHGIVHRDVKPANVMVSESGRVRLGDFGVAALLDDPTVSTSGAITGSPAYMAPEQATNKGAVAASDLWSLGATLYFAVEGQPPFDKGAPSPR